jgi:hypothetical protein
MAPRGTDVEEMLESGAAAEPERARRSPIGNRGGSPTGLGLRGLFQQGHEPGLLKMTVPSERLRYAFPLHDHKGNAIGQGPFLVGTLGVPWM